MQIRLSKYSARSIVCVLGMYVAWGNTASLAADVAPVQLEEIVVTAAKREESLSRAALAVSAVSQEALDKGGANQVQELVSQVPNLQVSFNGFSMRGIGSSNNSEAGSATVALHVDGVYLQRPQFLGLPIFDIERVEALRGPQGTLYGRNATAGVVNIITTAPKPGFEAFGDVSYGNYDEMIVRAAVNVPLSDTFAIRASAVRRKNDGYFDTKGSTPENYGKADQTGVRLAAKWDPTDNVSWRGIISYSGDKGTIPATVLRAYTTYTDNNINDGALGTANEVVLSGFDPRSGSNTVLWDAKNQLDYHETAFRSNLDWNLTDALSLSWIAGYSKLEDAGRQPTNNISVFLIDNTAKAHSEELDLKYESERLHGVLGLYYFNETQRNAAIINGRGSVPFPYSSLQGGTGPMPRIATSITIVSNTPERTSESQAAFGQLTYDLTDRLSLTGGLRYNEDKAISAHQYFGQCVFGTAAGPTFIVPGCTVPITPQTDIGGLSASWSNTSWKTILDYDVTDDVLLYASVGTGYRGGGVVGRNLPQQYWMFQPEEVTNYEVGLRSLWFGRSVSLNLTGFAMHYKDLQVTSLIQVPGGFTLPVTTNAAKAEINGIEFEGAWQITSSDKLNGFATWMDATFNNFNNAADSFLSPDTGYNNFRSATGRPALPTPSFDYTGNHLAGAPEWTLKASYAHVFDLGGAGRLTPTISAYWQSDAYLSTTNYVGDKVDAYSRTDINMLWQAPGEHLSAEAYVTNLEDKDVPLGYGANWGSAYVTYARPRLYGIRLGYRF